MITLLLVVALEYTRFGAQVRAAVDNQRMARGLGINVDGAFAFTFALGSGLAGLGGALAIEIVGLDPHFALTYLIYVLIVVSVGGLGSIGGSFAAATLIGISDVAGKYYVPELGAFLIYLVMVVLLMWRPGRPVREAMMSVTSRTIATPARLPAGAGALAPGRDRVLARDLAAVLALPGLPGAGEPDRHHGAVRALARPDPRLRRHRLARPRGLLRARRLYGGTDLQGRLGRADQSGLLLGALVAGIVGYAASFIVSRFRHLALIMITLGMCLLLEQLANSASWLTGGADGLQGVKMWPIFNYFRFDLYGKVAYTYSLVALFLVFLVARRIINSPFGLSLRGIRENFVRMPALGAPSRAHLRKIYTISAVMAGVAGALLAQTTETVSLEALGFQRSADVLVMLILGGAGRLYGGLVGAIIFMVARDQFSGSTPQFWYFWIGMLLIAVVMFLPNGILGGLAKLTESLRGKLAEQGVMSAALSTRGLDKSFGSLVVAKDIAFSCRRARATR